MVTDRGYVLWAARMTVDGNERPELAWWANCCTGIRKTLILIANHLYEQLELEKSVVTSAINLREHSRRQSRQL